MAEYKTPGVYIVEKNAFPNSVVEVATAVPAFIGYTEFARRGVEPLTNVPTRITSLAEYNRLFGGGPPLSFSFTASDDAGKPPFAVDVVPAGKSYFYNSLQMFFANGGGPCYIVSVGAFGDVVKAGGYSAIPLDKLVTNPLLELKKYAEPTMIVIPDMVLLPKDQWSNGTGTIIQHCQAMQSRIGIFDVFDGYKSRDAEGGDVIDYFRNNVNGDGDALNYGVAYYPWLNASIVQAVDIDFSNLNDDGLGQLVTYLKKQVTDLFPAGADGKVPDKGQAASDLLDKLSGQVSAAKANPGKSEVKASHQALIATLPGYQQVLDAMLLKANLLPPSGGIAGVYTRVDDNLGVFKAPANVTIYGAVSPAINITHDEQEDLNVPLSGKAINAIRTFPGRGMLIWGARTLDGNSQDWRYINVRRTMIMLEQSIKMAVESYMFAANNAQTWVTVKSMIVNFLTNKWKEGALQGGSPEDAFSVDVGLGTTMDANDILDGYMRVLVKVAVVHPAEFIVITFQQQMAKS